MFTRERATPFLTLTGVFDEQPLRDKSPIDVADVLRGKEAAQRVGGEGAENFFSQSFRYVIFIFISALKSFDS